MSVARILTSCAGGVGPEREQSEGDRIRLLSRRAGGRPETRRARAVARQRREHLRLQMLEMMRLAEESGDVGGQRSQHLLTLGRALRARHQIAIVAERSHLQSAQPLGQPRIDQRGLALLQMNAGVGVDHLRDAAEVVAAEQEIAGNHRPRPVAARGFRWQAHAASPTWVGMTLSSAIRLIMRSSIAITPMTKARAASEPISGVGCNLSAAMSMMSETASTSRPTICLPVCATMMT